MRVHGTPHRTVDWRDGALLLIDQPLLPHRFEVRSVTDHREAARRIAQMVVRGADAIGATGAFGLALAAREAATRGLHGAEHGAFLSEARALLAATRPTAQNLFYGLERVQTALGGLSTSDAADAALAAARAVAEEDAAACEAIGRHGAALLQDGWTVSTHCNAGWLAFVDWGSALSPVYRGRREGKDLRVLVDETRPRGQGARLTAWELAAEGVPHAVIADNAFGFLASRGEVDCVITGSDRVARNGDVANKIGTFGHAVIARHLGIPFYVALPAATIDPTCPRGADIPIEERDGDEVRWTWGDDDDGVFRRVRTTPDGAPTRNPAFDVTPAELVSGLITEHGVFPASADGVGRALLAAERVPGEL